ncbi:MAG: hypothetical protein AB1921_12420 [Thermodesulfobacteriota bacterium]
MPDADAIVALSDCHYAPWVQGRGLFGASLSVSRGDRVVIISDTNEDAHLLLRSMASLERPLRGRVLSHGRELDFSDYRRLLAYKAKVGYIASDCAVFSNRTLGESLLFASRYFEGHSSGMPEEEVFALCRHFEIEGKLHLRPDRAFEEDIRLTIIVRELAKNPEMLLIERPSTALDRPSHIQVVEKIKEIAATGLPVVLYTFDRDLIEGFANKIVWIERGRVTVTES